MIGDQSEECSNKSAEYVCYNEIQRNVHTGWKLMIMTIGRHKPNFASQASELLALPAPQSLRAALPAPRQPESSLQHVGAPHV